jgi:adenylate cyclase
MKVMTELRVKLTEGEAARISTGTTHLPAYLKLLKGSEHYFKRTPASNIMAKKLFEEAIDLDPQCGNAYALLGFTHVYDRIFRTSKDPEESLNRIFELAEKSLSLDQNCVSGYHCLAWAQMHNREHEKAIVTAKKAISLNPNYVPGIRALGSYLLFSGKAEDAVAYYQKAIRLNPFDHMAGATLGLAYGILGRYDEAVSILRDIMVDHPDFLQGHIYLAFLFGEAGLIKAAGEEVKEILRLSPGWSIQGAREVNPWKNQIDRDRWLAALRNAGLPEI